MPPYLSKTMMKWYIERSASGFFYIIRFRDNGRPQYLLSDGTVHNSFFKNKVCLGYYETEKDAQEALDKFGKVLLSTLKPGDRFQWAEYLPAIATIVQNNTGMIDKDKIYYMNELYQICVSTDSLVISVED